MYYYSISDMHTTCIRRELRLPTLKSSMALLDDDDDDDDY